MLTQWPLFMFCNPNSLLYMAMCGNGVASFSCHHFSGLVTIIACMQSRRRITKRTTRARLQLGNQIPGWDHNFGLENRGITPKMDGNVKKILVILRSFILSTKIERLDFAIILNDYYVCTCVCTCWRVHLKINRTLPCGNL